MNPLRPFLRLAAPAAIAASAAAAFGFSWFVGAGGVPLIWTAHYTTMYASPNTLPPQTTFGAQFRTSADLWAGNPNSDFRFFVNHGFHDPNYGDLDGGNDAYFAPLGYGTLAITYIYADSLYKELWDCDVAFDNYYAYTFAPGYYDFQSVASHELGHVLGLGHSTVGGPLMQPTIAAGELQRVLMPDDLAGETFLYPKPSGGGAPPPPGGGGPAPLPVRTGTMSGLSVSEDEVLVGDPLTFTATVFNNNSGTLLLSAAETTPIATGTWTEALLTAGETRGFSTTRTVADLPGLYPIRLRLGGIDPTMVYVAQQIIPGATVRVRRPVISLDVQDDLVASLGPLGDDRVELFLAKGQSVLLEVLTAPTWAGARTTVLHDPAGVPLTRWKPAKNYRARATGVHSLLVANTGSDKGTYRLYTESPGRPPRVRAKGLLDGELPAEVPFAAFARSTALLEVKGPKALMPRIVALRTPSGATLDVPDGAEVAVDEFDEDGIWTAIVEGAPGVAGKVRLGGRPEWLEGMEVTK